MSTVHQILIGAHSHARKLVPNIQISVDTGTEGVGFVARALAGLFGYGARVNPIYFGDMTTVVQSGGGWPIPVTADCAFQVEKTDATPVTIVDVDDRGAADGDPAVYEMGRVLLAVADDPDILLDDLNIFFARDPLVPAALTDPIDTLWPVRLDELLMAETAAWILIKDGRHDEAGSLITLVRDPWLSLYRAHVAQATLGVRRQWSRRFGELPPPRFILASAGG